MPHIVHFFCYWLPLLGYMAAIFVLSSGSLPPLPVTFNWSDKVAHFCEYGLLGALLWRAFRNAGDRWTARSAVWAAVTGMLYGASDEIHQGFVPGRHIDVTDWLADAVGVAVGVGLCKWLAVRGIESTEREP
jgi:VanZ family protein